MIYDIIIRNSIKHPYFPDYLHTENESVIDFCLKMIGVFEQEEAFSGILHFLENNNYNIRSQAIKTFGELGNKDAIPFLVELYYKEDKYNRIEIIKSLSKIEDNNSGDFLMNLLYGADNHIRMEAAKALIQSGNFKEVIVNEIIEKKHDLELQSIINHIKDKRI